MKIEIKNQYGKKTLHTIEIGDEFHDQSKDMQLRESVRVAVENKIDLSGVDLSGLDLSYLNLSGGIFRFVEMINTNLRSANLRGANLSDANLY